MPKRSIFLIVFALISFNKAFSQQSCPIIPLPQQFERGEGYFIIDQDVSIITRDKTFGQTADFFKDQILDHTGISLSTKGTSSSVIVLQKQKTTKAVKGEYSIQMQPNRIVVSAAENKGAFNGMMSLLQLALHAKEANSKIKIGCWNIVDYPLYSWRGFMLDESRHFFGKQVVKEILDQMALLKLNRFHWHLTDAPGWRLQIKKYPLLSLVGGIGDVTDSLKPAQYYTQDDIQEIVAYAKRRHITIIPEIDMPGHATAANRAYPEFSGGGTGKYANFTFNPGKAGTYDFLTNILKEVAILFPSGMVHLGGDEVSFGSKSWENKTEIKDLMQKNNLKDLKEVEQYFFRRMTDSALHFFNKILAWDEAADSNIPADSTIIYWWRHDKPNQLKKSLEKGFRVVLCPRIPLYLDFVQDSTHQQGRRWAGKYSTVRQVYSFDLDTYPVANEDPTLIIGIQGNLWTEQISSERRLEFMIFPRIAALAEAAWTRTKNRNYKNFLNRLKMQFPLYKEEGIYYFNPIHPDKMPEVID